MGTWKSCINVDHIAKERWGPPYVGADLHTFCQAFFFKALKEKTGEKDDSYKEMTRAARV